MQVHQTFSERSKGLKEPEVRREGDSGKVCLKELGVLVAIGIRIKDSVDIMEDLFWRGLLPVGHLQNRQYLGVKIRLPTVGFEMAEQIFNLPVRRGLPQDIGGLTDVVNSPIFATGVGLVKYGSRNLKAHKFMIGQENVFDKVVRRMKEWLQEFF